MDRSTTDGCKTPSQSAASLPETQWQMDQKEDFADLVASGKIIYYGGQPITWKEALQQAYRVRAAQINKLQ